MWARQLNSQTNRTEKRWESLLAVQHGRFVNAKPGLSMEEPDLEQVHPSTRPSRSCRDLNHGRPSTRIPARASTPAHPRPRASPPAHPRPLRPARFEASAGARCPRARIPARASTPAHHRPRASQFGASPPAHPRPRIPARASSRLRGRASTPEHPCDLRWVRRIDYVLGAHKIPRWVVK